MLAPEFYQISALDWLLGSGVGLRWSNHNRRTTMVLSSPCWGYKVKIAVLGCGTVLIWVVQTSKDFQGCQAVESFLFSFLGAPSRRCPAKTKPTAYRQRGERSTRDQQTEFLEANTVPQICFHYASNKQVQKPG